VLVVQTTAAMPGHFLKNVVEFLNYTSAPAVLDVYTPCQAEHGIADAAASRRARLSVESRMNPVFVHDPRRSDQLHGWFSLEGNPALDRDWTTTRLEHVEDGVTRLLEIPLTPAHFAYDETRFKKQFRKLAPDDCGVPVDEFIDLSPAEQSGKTPFIWATDDEKRLIQLEVSSTVVHLVEERRKYWRTLRYLAGRHVEQLDADHQIELEALQLRYRETVTAREASLDTIARAMSELAAASNAPVGGLATALGPFTGEPAPVVTAPAAAASVHTPVLATIHEDDVAKCTNCKTCYQQVSELFEKTTIVADGVPKEVAQPIPGAFAKVKVTPELVSRVARVAANCDAEIIQ
jgi:pyruvate-ferredoxin/flavodoxin oxidoreductase